MTRRAIHVPARRRGASAHYSGTSANARVDTVHPRCRRRRHHRRGRRPHPDHRHRRARHLCRRPSLRFCWTLCAMAQCACTATLPPWFVPRCLRRAFTWQSRGVEGTWHSSASGIWICCNLKNMPLGTWPGRSEDGMMCASLKMTMAMPSNWSIYAANQVDDVGMATHATRQR